MKFLLSILILFFSYCIFINAQKYVVKSYYPSGKLLSEISYSDSIRDGQAKFYYENGNLKEERNYVIGKVEGTVKLYHENGTLSEIFTIINGKREGPTSVFDSTGSYVNDVSYSSGKQDALNLNITSLEKTDSSYEATIEVLRHSFSGKDEPPSTLGFQSKSDPAYFVKLDVQPRPIGGMADIYNKLVYPEEAFKNNVHGTVEVLTFIDEYGNVVDMTIIKGLGYGCDESAKKAIRYTKFHPGFIKGVPVKSQLKITLEFKGYNH